MARRSIWRALGLITLVFGVIWLVMILRWRSENRVPNGVDIGLCLVALPVALLLGYVAVRFGIDAAKRRRARKANAAAGTEAMAASEPADDPSVRWNLPVLAGELLFAAGETPQALSDAARAGQRAELHQKFRDTHGLPVFAAEVDEVDADAIEALSDQLRDFNTLRQRNLWLAETVTMRLMEQHAALLEKPKAADTSPDDQPERPYTPLDLEWLLPSSWNEADRNLAGDWLARRLADQGWDSARIRIQCRAVNSGAHALARLDEINLQFHRGTTKCRLLLASDSSIDDGEIQTWDSAGRLHKAGRPEGRVPGEGACALLLGAAPNPDGNPPPQLHRMALAQRAQSVDTPGRLNANTLQELLQQSLSRCGKAITAEQLVYGIADTDVRPSRMAESLQLLDHALTESDPIAVLQPLGMANGDAGAATALALVAVAAALTRDQQQPGLIFSVHDGLARVVALVSPKPLAAADEAGADSENENENPATSPSLV